MRDADKEILRLSIPAIVSNITAPLLGLCDTAIAGHLGDDSSLAAIAVGTTAVNVLTGLLVFLRMGTTGLAAKACGMNDTEGTAKAFSLALYAAVAAGMLLLVFNRAVFGGINALIAPEANVASAASSYFTIRMYGMPAMLAVLAVSGWFVGMQSTFCPMVIAIVMNIVNVVASCLLVYAADMGFEGIAWGTTVSNWIGLAIALPWACRFSGGKRLFLPAKRVMDSGLLRKFAGVNGNLFLRSCCIMGVSLGMTAAGSRIGSLTLAANVVLMQFFTLFSYFMDGFANSGEALAGRCGGAGDSRGLKMTVTALLKWTLGTGLCFTAAYFIFFDAAVGCLTDSSAVWHEAAKVKWWVCTIPIVGCWAFIYDGFYTGVARTSTMAYSTFTATVVFFMPALFPGVLQNVPGWMEGNGMLWGAFSAYLAVRGIALALCWPSASRKVVTAGNRQPKNRQPKTEN